MRGLSDPRVAQAIRLHQAPCQTLDGQRSAADCAPSRSTLFERFTDLTGMTPDGLSVRLANDPGHAVLSETGISIAISPSASAMARQRVQRSHPLYRDIAGQICRQRAALNVSRPALT